MYRGEAASLNALLRTGTIKVPKPLKVDGHAATFTVLNRYCDRYLLKGMVGYLQWNTSIFLI